MQDEQLHKY